MGLAESTLSVPWLFFRGRRQGRQPLNILSKKEPASNNRTCVCVCVCGWECTYKKEQLQYITLQYIALHCITLPYLALRYATLRSLGYSALQ